MVLDPAALPDDVAALKAMLIAADKRAVVAEARAHDLDAEIETLKLTIAKLQHDRFGNASERTSVLMDQPRAAARRVGGAARAGDGHR